MAQLSEEFAAAAARVRADNLAKDAPERLLAAIETLCNDVTRTATPANIRRVGKTHLRARLENLHGAVLAYGVLTGQQDHLGNYMNVMLPVHVSELVDEADEAVSKA